MNNHILKYAFGVTLLIVGIPNIMIAQITRPTISDKVLAQPLPNNTGNIIVNNNNNNNNNNTSAVNTEPKGPSSKVYVELNKIIPIDNLEGAGIKLQNQNQVLSVSESIYQDENKESGIYYYLPAKFVLDWNPTNEASKKYNMAIVDIGAEKYTLQLYITPLKPLQEEISIIKDIITDYNKGAAPVKELRAFPASKIELSLEVNSSIKIENLSLPNSAMTTPFPIQINITKTTDQSGAGLMEVKTFLTRALGVTGNVKMTYKDNQILTPCVLKINAEETFGTFFMVKNIWRTIGWKNPTDYPVRINSFNVLRKETTDSRIYTWQASENTIVPPGRTITFNASKVPATVDSDAKVKKIWIDYNVVECDTCNNKIVDSILLKGINKGQSQPVRRPIQLMTFNAFGFKDIFSIQITVESAQFGTDTNTNEGRTIPPFQTDKNEIIHHIYTRNGRVNFRYQMRFFMKTGSTVLSDWIPVDTNEDYITMFIGCEIIKKHTPDFKNRECPQE